MSTLEGTIEIDLIEFWEWVTEKHSPVRGGESLYGRPRVDSGALTMEIPFAWSSQCSPNDWAVRSEASKSWDELV